MWPWHTPLKVILDQVQGDQRVYHIWLSIWSWYKPKLYLQVFCLQRLLCTFQAISGLHLGLSSNSRTFIFTHIMTSPKCPPFVKLKEKCKKVKYRPIWVFWAYISDLSNNSRATKLILVTKVHMASPMHKFKTDCLSRTWENSQNSAFFTKNGRFDLSRSSKVKFKVTTEITIYDFPFECAII